VIATRQLAKRQLTWLRSAERCVRLALESPDLQARVVDLAASARADADPSAGPGIRA
jgi:tRNA A37 N6-isopentenylltransferase MiaA